LGGYNNFGDFCFVETAQVPFVYSCTPAAVAFSIDERPADGDCLSPNGAITCVLDPSNPGVNRSGKLDLNLNLSFNYLFKVQWVS
jgi:hypothetical protein